MIGNSPRAHCISMESCGVRMRFKPQTNEPPPTLPCTAICPASRAFPHISQFSQQMFYLPLHCQRTPAQSEFLEWIEYAEQHKHCEWLEIARPLMSGIDS